MTRNDPILKAAQRVQRAARKHDARTLRAGGQTQAQVAARFGVDRSTVSRWEKS